ncbi:MAG: amidohydrolase family protein, partial [Myxococcota bacterium]
DSWQRKRERADQLNRQAEAAGETRRVKRDDAPKPPERDFALDTLAAVLSGDVLVQVHCYRAGEMREMIAIADEFGFTIRSFHHALEAYKIKDLLAKRGVAINTWAQWWGFKMEAFDGIPENAAMVTAAGGRAVIHSDSAILIQRLNQEAAEVMYAARHAGIPISEDQALRWVTADPAWVLGIEDVTGTLEVGKRGDVVLWNRSPFSVYSKTEVVIQGGHIAYRRGDGRQPTDFELGNSVHGGLTTHKGSAP